MLMKSIRIVDIYARYALALTFTSATADRFGWFGNFMPNQISWGNFSNFLLMVSKLYLWAPSWLIPALGIVATVWEIVLAILLILKIRPQLTAILSIILLFIFLLSMVFSGMAKSMVDHGVLCAISNAILIYYINSYLLSKSNENVGSQE